MAEASWYYYSKDDGQTADRSLPAQSLPEDYSDNNIVVLNARAAGQPTRPFADLLSGDTTRFAPYIQDVQRQRMDIPAQQANDPRVALAELAYSLKPQEALFLLNQIQAELRQANNQPYGRQNFNPGLWQQDQNRQFQLDQQRQIERMLAQAMQNGCNSSGSGTGYNQRMMPGNGRLNMQDAIRMLSYMLSQNNNGYGNNWNNNGYGNNWNNNGYGNNWNNPHGGGRNNPYANQSIEQQLINGLLGNQRYNQPHMNPYQSRNLQQLMRQQMGGRGSAINIPFLRR